MWPCQIVVIKWMHIQGANRVCKKERSPSRSDTDCRSEFDLPNDFFLMDFSDFWKSEGFFEDKIWSRNLWQKKIWVGQFLAKISEPRFSNKILRTGGPKDQTRKQTWNQTPKKNQKTIIFQRFFKDLSNLQHLVLLFFIHFLIFFLQLLLYFEY